MLECTPAAALPSAMAKQYSNHLPERIDSQGCIFSEFNEKKMAQGKERGKCTMIFVDKKAKRVKEDKKAMKK